MKDLFPLQGIVTVLNTPFNHRNKIDFSALARNIHQALQAGVVGFLLPAMASEVHSLSKKEKLGMLEVALETVNGTVPVFAGTASYTLSDSRDMIKAYQGLGCEHFLIQLPYQSDIQFKSDFLKLVESDPKVVMLQDWDFTGYGLPDELILELFEQVPAFRCLKIETVPASLKYSKILKLTDGKLHVSGGWAVAQMMEALQRGVHAFMPTGMHWIYCTIFREYSQGNHVKAKSLFNEILPVLAFSNQHLDISILFFKRLLWRQGVYPTAHVRQPKMAFDTIQEQIADELIDKVVHLEEDIQRGV